MCVSCGCGQVNDKHGDERNISLNDIDQAAQAAGTNRDEVMRNIMNASKQAGTTSGQGQTGMGNQGQTQGR